MTDRQGHNLYAAPVVDLWRTAACVSDLLSAFGRDQLAAEYSATNFKGGIWRPMLLTQSNLACKGSNDTKTVRSAKPGFEGLLGMNHNYLQRSFHKNASLA